MQITLNIPDELLPRIQAVLRPGTEVDNRLVVKVLKKFLAEQEFRKWQMEKQQQGEAESRAKIEALNQELGLNEVP